MIPMLSEPSNHTAPWKCNQHTSREEVQLSLSSRRLRWPHLPCQQVFASDIMAFTRVINTLHCCPRWSSPRPRSCHHDFLSLLFSWSIFIPFLLFIMKHNGPRQSRTVPKWAQVGELSARRRRYGGKRRLVRCGGTEMCLIAPYVGQLVR